MKVVVFLLSVLLTAGSVAAQTSVYFADARLKAQVEAELGIPNPTSADMLALTYLYAGSNDSPSSPRITSLTGLEYATNLTRLLAWHHAVTSLAPLTGLSQLEEIQMSTGEISDLSPLAGLTNLRVLNVHANHVASLAPLAGLIHLRDLNVRVSSISSVSPLAGLTELEELDLEYNLISDLTPLAGLSNLSSLKINRNQISSLAPLAGLSQLRHLGAYSNQISSLAPLAGLTHLEVLVLNNNQISDLSPLRQLTSLTRLEVRMNPLSPQAYDEDIPQILANNPGISLYYDAPDPQSGQRRLSVSASTGGTVVAPGKGQFTYADGASVRLEAKADPGFVFTGWSGDLSLTQNPVWLTMDRDYQTQANFVSTVSALHVDDDAPGDPAPRDLTRSDPQENGTAQRPFDSIQEAIEAAPPGGSVLVHPGTYREQIDLLGKDIHLTGTGPDDPAGTAWPVIEGMGNGPLVSFRSGESPACTFLGFVLTRGQGSSAGAIYCAKSDPTIAHCLIVGNRASDPNGAAAYFVYSRAVLSNCTIADNYAGSAGAGVTLLHSDVVISNSILWGNSPREILVLGTSLPSIRYCDVQGGWPDASNLDRDPLFARRGYWAGASDPRVISGPEDPGAVWALGDYHLQSQTGRWNPDTRAWVQDAASSPCLDRGDPASPVGAEPAPNGGRINLGAYGGTSEASKAIGTP